MASYDYDAVEDGYENQLSNSRSVTPRRASANMTPRRAAASPRSYMADETPRSVSYTDQTPRSAIPSRASVANTPRSVAAETPTYNSTPRRAASVAGTPRGQRPSLAGSVSASAAGTPHSQAGIPSLPSVMTRPLSGSAMPYSESQYTGTVQSASAYSQSYAQSYSQSQYPGSVYAESARYASESTRSAEPMRYAQSEAGYPVAASAAYRQRPDTADLSEGMTPMSHHMSIVDGSYLSPRSVATGRGEAALHSHVDSPKGSEYGSPYSHRYYNSQSSQYADSQGYTPRLSIMYSPKGSIANSHSSSPGMRSMLPSRAGTEMAYSIAADPDQYGMYDGFGNKEYMGGKEEYDMFTTVEEQDLHNIKVSPTITKNNYLGLLVFLFYLGVTFFYFYVRVNFTLDIGFDWYAGLVFAIEVVGFTATLGYGVLLCRMTISARTEGLRPAPKGYIPDENNLKFHCRILVPCYKESLEIVEATCRAAMEADLPFMTKRTLYLCDDGNDPAKREMIERMGPDCVYVTGRVRDPNGEINGKSNNLNNCLKMIYPDGAEVPVSEVVVVFDADMVAQPNFYTKALECMIDDKVSLILTPQGFHNVNAQRDIFNNLNLSFWEYILPGCDAFGYIACTGTNFIIRSKSLAECGFFPNFTITEDYALGMLMKAKGMQAKYLNEYLAIGEAPEEIRNIFRQRSRWCKGQMQVLFSRSCPLFFPGLPLFHKWLYTSVTWCYITNTLCVPVSVMVPFIAMTLGIYPLVLNKEFALGSTLFFFASSLINVFCLDRRHIKPMWFCVVSCNLLWFTFAKASFMTCIKQMLGKSLTFKTTKKKGVGEENTATGCLPANLGDMEGTKDHWIIFASIVISFITLVACVYQIIDEPYTAQGDFRWYLLLSGFWAIYNAMPPVLFVFYIYNKGPALSSFATFCLATTYIVAIGALVCIWLVPADYDAGQVLDISLKFIEAQRSGKLPRDNPYPFVKDSGLFDSIILPNGRNISLVGGWYHDGGYMKLTYPVAVTTAFLAWGFLEFGNGYQSSGNGGQGARAIQWGADYLTKAHLTNFTSAGVPLPDWLVAQVGDMKTDNNYWGRSDMMPTTRPAYVIDTTHPGSDLLAATSAALAASARAMKSVAPQQSGVYLARAVRLYEYAVKFQGYYAKWVPSGALYNSTSYYDDLAWAAVWLYAATNNAKYLDDAVNWHASFLEKESNPAQDDYVFNWNNVIWGVDLLLADFTKQKLYKQRCDVFAEAWKKGLPKHIVYTQKKLARAGGEETTLAETANAAMWMALYARRQQSNQFMVNLCWVRSQVAYVLGDSGRSYLTGYSTNSPEKIPHRQASCPADGDCTWETAYYSTEKNPNVLYGALVGGPDANDNFRDERDMYSIRNRVGILNNAGFSTALAALRYDKINMAKCEQGNGMIQNIILKVQGKSNIPGLRWFDGSI